MWLPDFQPVIDRAADRVAGRVGASALDLRIDDPQSGRIVGETSFGAYRAWSEEWLRARAAQAREIAITVGEGRVVGEFEVELSQEGRTFALPVALVAEPDVTAGQLAIRVYHSQWPLLGHHVLRPPLLSRDPNLRESDVVGEYQAALAAGDTDRITATFEDDGCFREPAGGEFRVCGREVLREFFARFFSAGGGITLEHCSVTEDGTRTALEFNAVKWGSIDMPPQAGVAVYERGATGQLREARIYDDVEGPVE
jgi:ketosteroid isomerase-like protein